MNIYQDPKALQAWFDRVKGDREGTVDNLRQEIADHQFGMRDFTGSHTPGRDRMIQIYDTTALFSNQILAGGIHGFLTTPAGIWFEYETEPRSLMDDSDIRFWLDDARDRTLQFLNHHKTGWSTNLAEVYLDLPGFGMGCLWIDSHPTNIATISARPLREVYIQEDDGGFVDVVFRQVEMTARQFATRYPKPIDRCFIIEKALENDTPEAKFTVMQLVGKSDDPYAGTSPFRKPFTSSIWIKDSDNLKMVENKGYEEMPVLTPRWTVDSDEIYGRGPGQFSLAPAKMLNSMMRTIIVGAQKAVDPPLLAADQGVLSGIRTTPGGVTYVQDRPGVGGQPDAIRPLQNNARLDLGIEILTRIETQVQRHYWADVLQLFQKPNMSATEVLAVGVQAMRLMGPVTGRILGELLEPAVDRLTGILMRRRNFFLPMPSQLRGATIRPKFISAISRSQSMSEAQSIMQTWGGAAQIAQYEGKPDAMDVLNSTESVRRLHLASDAPSGILRTIEEVEEMQVQRANVAAQQTALNQVGQGAEIAAKLGQANQQASQQAA